MANGAKTPRARPLAVSWLNRCGQSFEYDLETDRTVLFYDQFVDPEIPSMDDDIEHIMLGNDRIDKLARLYYKDERLWWVIALRNGMDLPMVGYVMGDLIIIPSPKWVRDTLVR